MPNAAESTGAAATAYEIAPNTKATLAKGDAVYGGPQTPVEVSNEGSEPAVFLLVNFGPESQMGPPEATPAS